MSTTPMRPSAVERDLLRSGQGVRRAMLKLETMVKRGKTKLPRREYLRIKKRIRSQAEADAALPAAIPTGAVSATPVASGGVWQRAKDAANAKLIVLSSVPREEIPWNTIAQVLTALGFDGSRLLGKPQSEEIHGDAEVGNGMKLRVDWCKSGEGKGLFRAEVLNVGEGTLNESTFLCEGEPSMDAPSIAKQVMRTEVKDEPLAKAYVQYIKSGNVSVPTGPITLVPELGNCAYRIQCGFGGPEFVRIKPQTDTLLKFENSVMRRVIGEIDQFWTLRENYRKLGFKFTRGVLLHGPPGGGKSSLIQQVVEMITARGDVVFFARRVSDILECMNAFRQVEPDRKVVVVLEDMDEYVNHQEREMLQLLDGENAQSSVLYLGTTNYLDRLPRRLMRPGRFDKKVYVGMPPEEGRYAYLKNKLSEFEDDAEIRRLARETAGFSFGHLREFVVAVYALRESKTDVLARLQRDSVSTKEVAETSAR